MSSRYRNKKTWRCTGQEAGSYPREADRVAQRSPRTPTARKRGAHGMHNMQRRTNGKAQTRGWWHTPPRRDPSAGTIPGRKPTSRTSIHMQADQARWPSYLTDIPVRWPASTLRPSSARDRLPNLRESKKEFFFPSFRDYTCASSAPIT